MGAQDIKRFRRDLESNKRSFKRGLRRAADRGGSKYTNSAKRNIIEQDAVASTELFRGIKSQSTDGMSQMAKGADVRTGVRLQSTAPHSGYIEHGTGSKGDGTYPRPGNPSTQRIAQWMIEKPSMNVGPHLWTRAEYIANRISKQGIDKQPFFASAVDDAMYAVVGVSRLEVERLLDI